MKYIAILFFVALAHSCNFKTEAPHLKPQLELLDSRHFSFIGKQYEYPQMDSVLSAYKLEIPERLQDSIWIKLIVNVGKVNFKEVQHAKLSLQKKQTEEDHLYSEK
jgi:hypothetical protein